MISYPMKQSIGLAPISSVMSSSCFRSWPDSVVRRSTAFKASEELSAAVVRRMAQTMEPCMLLRLLITQSNFDSRESMIFRRYRRRRTKEQGHPSWNPWSWWLCLKDGGGSGDDYWHRHKSHLVYDAFFLTPLLSFNCFHLFSLCIFPKDYLVWHPA